jgi:hypothetical protein
VSLSEPWIDEEFILPFSIINKNPLTLELEERFMKMNEKSKNK